MLVGDRFRFGIQYELDCNYDGAWLFGKICYWVSGLQVGNYELGTSLRDVLLQMKYIVGDCGNRLGGALCNLSDNEVFNRIDGSLYGTEPVYKNFKQLPDLDMPARYNIAIPVDVFDGCRVFLITCGSSERIIFRANGCQSTGKVLLNAGSCDKVIKEFYEILDKKYEDQVKN